VDEPAVQAAKAAHFAAHGAALPLPYAVNALPLAAAPFAAPLAAAPLAAIPALAAPGLVAHPNGAVVPVDEPAVQIERANHLASHGLNIPAALGYANGFGINAYAYAPAFAGLVAHPNGAVVPVDEPAVQAARAAHLAHFG
jgi:hypothetical protein